MECWRAADVSPSAIDPAFTASPNNGYHVFEEGVRRSRRKPSLCV